VRSINPTTYALVIATMATSGAGEAAAYYQAPHGPPPEQRQTEYSKGGQYGQAPPQYDMSYGPQGYEATGQKLDFNQAFKVGKPKWNDLWAGLLFIATFAAFVVISGISIQGYASTKGFNGGGIYDSKYVMRPHR
jgi:hypothetical protein